MPRNKVELPIDTLRAAFTYDPDTGFLCDRSSGLILGLRQRNGHMTVSLAGRMMLVHRVCWAIHHGRHPTAEVFHLDRDRSNNRASNLVDASKQDIQRRRLVSKNNTSGHRGVGWRQDRSKWQAQLWIRHKRVHLGYFDTKAEAITARRLGEIKFGYDKLAN